jgi:hypothetical protein
LDNESVAGLTSVFNFQHLHAAKRKTRHTVFAFDFFDQAKQGSEFNVPGSC